MELSSSHQPPYSDDWDYDEDPTDDYYDNNTGEGKIISDL